MGNSLIKVLIIDDDRDDYLLTQDWLSEIEGKNYNLEWISNYNKALEAILRQEHDVILLDYRLGEHNGLELLHEAIKQDCQKPIIILTGQGDHDIDVEAMKAGASDYLVKGQITSSMLERSIRYAIERYRTLEELRESELKFRSVTQSANDAIISIDSKGNIVSWNKGAKNIFGYTKKEILGKQATIIMPERYRDAHKKGVKRLNSAGKPQILGKTVELHGLRKDKTEFPLEFSLATWKTRNGIFYSGTIRDISDRKGVEEKLFLTAKMFENTSEGIMVTDADLKIQSVNFAFTSITGYDEKEILGKNPNILKSGQQNSAFYHKMWDSLLKNGQWQGEIWNRRKNGEVYPEWLTISTIKNDEKIITHYVAIFSDITKIKVSQKRLNYLAHHDPLTGVANRLLFNDRLQHDLWQAERNNQLVGLLYLDLDRFKIINDSLGHATGDLLLRLVAERLKECIRKNDTIARLGGDEFTIILPMIKQKKDAAKIAQKITDVFSKPFVIDNREFYSSASIGISLYPNDTVDMEVLLKNADKAMYHAKDKGRNNYQFFEETMSTTALEWLTMETKLRHALENNEFKVYFQPQTNLSTGEFVGMEALIRWQHLGKLISPDKFIPVAEETGLIVPIGEWVLRTACTQNKAWQDAGLLAIPVAVNISAKQFQQIDLFESIDQILMETGLDPSYLELELTESLVMNDPETTIAILQKIKEKGIKISIDDFGTGYSSLSYLKRFPIDKLKIDQAFVRDIVTNSDDAAIAGAIISLGHSLKLQVIAEGVENKAQSNFLSNLKCDKAQGFYYSKPIPAEDFSLLLKKNTILPQ